MLQAVGKIYFTPEGLASKYLEYFDGATLQKQFMGEISTNELIVKKFEDFYNGKISLSEITSYLDPNYTHRTEHMNFLTIKELDKHLEIERKRFCVSFKFANNPSTDSFDSWISRVDPVFGLNDSKENPIEGKPTKFILYLTLKDRKLFSTRSYADTY